MRSGMAHVNEGSHSFTCHTHVYPRMEWAILPLLRKHLPDGTARARSTHPITTYYSFIDLGRMKGWVGLRNNSILMLKVNGQGQESQKTVPAWVLALSWVLPLFSFLCHGSLHIEIPDTADNRGCRIWNNRSLFRWQNWIAKSIKLQTGIFRIKRLNLWDLATFVAMFSLRMRKNVY